MLQDMNIQSKKKPFGGDLQNIRQRPFTRSPLYERMSKINDYIEKKVKTTLQRQKDS